MAGRPSESALPLALIAVLVVLNAAGLIVSFAFQAPWWGVYFAIITQAVALDPDRARSSAQQGFTGGGNGITDLKTLLGWDIRTDHAKVVLVLRVCGPAAGISRAVPLGQSSALGTLLLAMRDKEDRVHLLRLRRVHVQVFAFCLAAMLSPSRRCQVHAAGGFMSPSFVGIVPSIEMVIFAAVGGRMSPDRRDLRRLIVEQQDLLQQPRTICGCSDGCPTIGVSTAFPTVGARLWRIVLRAAVPTARP